VTVLVTFWLPTSTTDTVPAIGFENELRYSVRRNPTKDGWIERLTLLPEEQPYASAVVEEIQASFLGYEFLPPEVGSVVPDIGANLKREGEVTLYNAPFTDNLPVLRLP